MSQRKKSGAISRRRFMATAAAGTAGALLATELQQISAAATRRRPNILFIITDDLGFGDLSLYGQTAYQTPNLDQLAQDGIRFTNAYAAQTVCTPTRVAFFTGRYPARTPVGLREPLPFIQQVGDSVGLPPEHPTIASLLKAGGYETALVGKWHVGYVPTYGPLKSGFDEYFGNLSGGIDYFTHKDSNGTLDFYEGEELADVPGYATDLYTQRAVDFIQRPRNRPFYLSLHYNAPHWPWQGPDDEESSRTFYPSNPFTAGGSPETYAAMMTSLDQGVGKVLQALQDSGQADNTIVVFTSDNGGERFSNFGPYQGRKGSLYEGGIRVPAFIRWNGVIPPNQVTDQVLITQDLTATLLAATGTKPDPQYPLDGSVLLSVIKGQKPAVSRTLFWRYGANPANRQNAVRSGKWKYLSIRGEEFLFDLSTDPGETVNLKDKRAGTFAKLKARFQEWESQVLPYSA